MAWVGNDPLKSCGHPDDNKGESVTGTLTERIVNETDGWMGYPVLQPGCVQRVVCDEVECPEVDDLRMRELSMVPGGNEGIVFFITLLREGP